MKISELSNINQMIRQGTGIDHHGVTEKPTGFRAALQNVNDSNALAVLTKMREDLDRQGVLVGKRCDMLELKRYKELLAQFMYEAVNYSFKFKKRNTMDARGRHRIYAIIRMINDKLAALTEDMLAGQKDNVAVMAAIDDIRGMLLDLYM